MPWQRDSTPLHIAIVDDLDTDREKLENTVSAFFSRNADVSCDIMTHASGEELLEAFSPGMFDLAFLDIQMDGMSGIDLAKSLRALDTKLMIVFLTSSKEYAFDAFPVHPFDYLVKPFAQRTLDDLLREVLRVMETPEPELNVRTSGGMLSVPYASICSLVSQGHAVEMRLTDGQTLACANTFTEISEAVTGDARFLLCNRGIVVNMDHVASLADDVLRMKDGTLFPLRVRGRSAVISQFSQYMVSRMEKGGRR